MKLNSLVLSGFKSFADRTEIKLGQGITAVVGPNGCGKSNISDAVRWVMGESRASRLRQDSSADIIFNGCSARAASDWCSVEMRLLNDGGRDLGMWKEYAELSVRRQVDRGGDSNYFINGQSVRRRDVVDLFAGTGAGARSYGIVAQEQITQIAQSEPQHLRYLLEDAAGVSVYKERRKETERSLLHTKENLERLENLAGELRQRVETLAKQAKLTVIVRQAKAELNQAQCLELVYHQEQLEATSASTKLELEQASKQRQAAQQQLANQEQKLQKVRNERKHRSDRLPKQQSVHYAATAELERIRQLMREDAIVQKQNEQQQADTDAAIAVQEISCDQLSKDVKGLQDVATASVNQRTRDADAIRKARQLLAKYQSNLAKARRKTEQQQAQLSKTTRAEQEAIAAKELAVQRSADNRQQQAGAEQELDNLAPAEQYDQQRLRQLRSAAATAKQDAHELAAKTQETQDALFELRDECHRLQSKIGGMNAELQLLQSMAGKHQQRYSQWLKDHGLCSSAQIVEQRIFEAEGLERAMDAALGVLLEGYEAADLASYGKSADLPEGLVLVEPAKATKTAQAYPPHPHMELLLNKIRCTPRWQATLSGWLSGVYFAPEHATALTWQKQLRPGEMVVTTDGRCYRRAALSVPDRRHLGFAWKAQLKRTEQKLASANAKLAQLQKRQQADKENYDKLVTQSQQQVALREEAQKSLAAAEKEALRCEHAAEFHAQQSQRLQATIASCAASAAQQDALVKKAERTLVRVCSVADEARAQQLACAEQLTAAEAMLEEQRETCNQLVAAQRENQLSAEHARQRIDDLQSRLAEQQQQVADSKQRLAQIKAQLQLCGKNRYEHELATANSDVAKTKQGLEKIELLVQEASQQELVGEQQLAQLRSKLEQKSQACHQLELDFTGRSSEARAMQKQIEQHGVTPQELERMREQCADAKQVAQLIAKLQRKIDRSGPVNYAADAEHAESEQRLQYMEEQMDDLRHALEALQVAIRRIDQEMLTRLKQVYASLNLRFDALFKSLFDGGSAALTMVGDSLLSAGLQLEVNPPGKQVRNIQALSGGEKTLVGLAFLFALNELNLPPFCILDEVDAALDETNTRRYTKLIETMRSRTQFLLVTHNRAVIEKVDRMIGVTQEQKGVSKIVSVKMDALLDNAQQISSAAA